MDRARGMRTDAGATAVSVDTSAPYAADTQVADMPADAALPAAAVEVSAAAAVEGSTAAVAAGSMAVVDTAKLTNRLCG